MKTLKCTLDRVTRYLGGMLSVELTMLLVTPAIMMAQATVDLGTAANFGLLANTAITGVATIVGDVGSNAAIDATILAPGYTLYPGGGPVVNAAHIDLLSAYNDAAGRSPDSTINFQLGGQSLSPGVYKSVGGTFDITGILTLDGSGVYIFQMTTTLITAAGSSVSLTNGAKWTDVFWQVGSSATLGANASLEGNILAFTTITTGAGITVNGRLLAKGAAITVYGSVNGSDQPLPVEMTEFYASANSDGGIELSWRTESEVENLGFRIWRSFARNGDYQCLTPSIIPGQGNKSSATEYKFTDSHVNKGVIYFYKIEQIDYQGTSEFFGPFSGQVASPVLNEYKLYSNYPNPFNPETTIRFDVFAANGQMENINIQIYNSLGQRVRTLVNEAMSIGEYSITWDGKDDNGRRIATGTYFYQLQVGDFTSTKKMSLLK